MVIETSLIVAVVKIGADVGASILNHKIRQMRKSKKQVSSSLTYLAIVFNTLSLNIDKVGELVNLRKK